jgi:hypothetical protein
MRYADTAVHVYQRPTAWPVLRGNEGALQVALGLAEAMVFFGVLWVIGSLVAELA